MKNCGKIYVLLLSKSLRNTNIHGTFIHRSEQKPCSSPFEARRSEIVIRYSFKATLNLIFREYQLEKQKGNLWERLSTLVEDISLIHRGLTRGENNSDMFGC